MIWIIIILGLAILLASTRLFLLHREIADIAQDLSEMDDLDSNRRLKTKTGDRYVAGLAAKINRRMDKHRDDKLQTRQMELELREAITSISHDLRTPLTSILGYLQMIKKSMPDTDENMEYLKIAEYRAKSLGSLINDLFELSAVSSHDYELSLEPVKLNNIVLEGLISFYDSFSAKGITPDIEVPEEAVTVTGNTQAIKRVIENLVSNALKYSSGEIAVNLEKQGNVVALSIRNTVENFNPDDVELIFNRFYGSNKADGAHTGLGLAIAKALMYKMGGEITAKIQENHLCIHCEWKVSI